MTKKQKLIHKLLSRSKNISFTDAQAALEAYGFRLTRINGSHHIYTHPKVPVLVNLQNVDGKAKPYQIKQFLEAIERYNLSSQDQGSEDQE